MGKAKNKREKKVEGLGFWEDVSSNYAVLHMAHDFMNSDATRWSGLEGNGGSL